MLSDLLRWGGKRPRQPDASGKASVSRGDAPMPSKAFPKMLAAIAAQPDPAVLLDLGPVIGSNVEFFGERLGCKLFIEDLFAEFDRHSRAGTLDDLAKAFDTRFRHADGSVDGILCWDVFDFLPKAAAQSLARQIIRMLRPAGRGDGLLLNRRRAAPPDSRSTKSSTTTCCGTGNTPAPAGRSTSSPIATSSGCSKGSSSPTPSC